MEEKISRIEADIVAIEKDMATKEDRGLFVFRLMAERNQTSYVACS